MFKHEGLHFDLNGQRDHGAILQLPDLDTSDQSSMEDVSRYLSRRIRKLAKEDNLNLRFGLDENNLKGSVFELQDCLHGL